MPVACFAGGVQAQWQLLKDGGRRLARAAMRAQPSRKPHDGPLRLPEDMKLRNTGIALMCWALTCSQGSVQRVQHFHEERGA